MEKSILLLAELKLRIQDRDYPKGLKDLLPGLMKEFQPDKLLPSPFDEINRCDLDPCFNSETLLHIFAMCPNVNYALLFSGEREREINCNQVNRYGVVPLYVDGEIKKQ